MSIRLDRRPQGHGPEHQRESRHGSIPRCPAQHVLGPAQQQAVHGTQAAAEAVC